MVRYRTVVNIMECTNSPVLVLVTYSTVQWKKFQQTYVRYRTVLVRSRHHFSEVGSNRLCGTVLVLVRYMHGERALTDFEKREESSYLPHYVRIVGTYSEKTLPYVWMMSPTNTYFQSFLLINCCENWY